MPFIQRIVDPIYVSRCGSEAFKVDFKIESDCLIDVTNVTLINVIRQLLSLRHHAEDMFVALKEESLSITDRLSALEQRVRTLTNKAETLTLDFHLFESHQMYVEAEQEIVSRDRRPAAVRDLYNACQMPPDLSSLDRFRDDGLSSMKLYSNPSFFFDLWYSQVQEVVAKERAKGHRHHKQLHTQNRERRVRKVAAHVHYHLDKERIQGMGASKDKPGAIEHSPSMGQRKEMQKKKKKKREERSKEEYREKKNRNRKRSKTVENETHTNEGNNDKSQQSTACYIEAPSLAENIPPPPASFIEHTLGGALIKAQSHNDSLPVVTVTPECAQPVTDRNISTTEADTGININHFEVDADSRQNMCPATNHNAIPRVALVARLAVGQVSYKQVNRKSRVLCAIASNSQPDDDETCSNDNSVSITGLPLPPPPSFLLNDSISEEDEQVIDDFIPPPPEPLFVYDDEPIPKAIPPPIFEPLPEDDCIRVTPAVNIKSSVRFPPSPPIRFESQDKISSKGNKTSVCSKKESLKSPPPPPSQRLDSKVPAKTTSVGLTSTSTQLPPPPPPSLVRADKNAERIPQPGGKTSTGSVPSATHVQTPPPPPPLMGALLVRQDKQDSLQARRCRVASTFFDLSDNPPPVIRSSGRPNMLSLLSDIRSGKKILNHVAAPEPSVALRKCVGGGVQAAMMAMIDARRPAIGSSDEESNSSSSDWESDS